jgi:hypothetical protein
VATSCLEPARVPGYFLVPAQPSPKGRANGRSPPPGAAAKRNCGDCLTVVPERNVPRVCRAQMIENDPESLMIIGEPAESHHRCPVVPARFFLPRIKGKKRANRGRNASGELPEPDAPALPNPPLNPLFCPANPTKEYPKESLTAFPLPVTVNPRFKMFSSGVRLRSA